MVKYVKDGCVKIMFLSKGEIASFVQFCNIMGYYIINVSRF